MEGCCKNKKKASCATQPCLLKITINVCLCYCFCFHAFPVNLTIFEFLSSAEENKATRIPSVAASEEGQ